MTVPSLECAQRYAVSPRRTTLLGDARDRLRELPDGSVDMVLTSPPYFRLRDYGHAGQLGLETHVEQWVEGLAAVITEAKRVLVPTGTLWLNIADSYARRPRDGARPKSLLLGPERLALRLLDDGWIIRNRLIWSKPNPMPVSVRDRLAATYEFVYVLARQPSYFFDLDTIRVPPKTSASRPRTISRDPETWRGPNSLGATGLDAMKATGRVAHPLGKNPGDVWSIATSSYRGAHHAVFPVALAERAIRAGCPEARCTVCRLPWRRSMVQKLGGAAVRTALRPGCNCDAASEPGMVLDPFMGAGTTAVAAERLNRDWLGIELNPDFAELAGQRISRSRAKPGSSTSGASTGSAGAAA